jgi:hypothetical protein
MAVYSKFINCKSRQQITGISPGNKPKEKENRYTYSHPKHQTTEPTVNQAAQDHQQQQKG